MEQTPTTRPSLLVRLKDPGDERAWEEFAAIYSPLIYGLGRRKGLQHADAADLVQDVLRAVASAIGRWHRRLAGGIPTRHGVRSGTGCSGLPATCCWTCWTPGADILRGWEETASNT
jgi:hypothetical protein